MAGTDVPPAGDPYEADPSLAGMDEASSYMDQNAAETTAPSYDQGAAANADIDTGDAASIPDTTPEDDTSGMA